jgi:hypothetical protein
VRYVLYIYIYIYDISRLIKQIYISDGIPSAIALLQILVWKLCKA